jgi:hypothetical protein
VLVLDVKPGYVFRHVTVDGRTTRYLVMGVQPGQDGVVWQCFRDPEDDPDGS